MTGFFVALGVIVMAALFVLLGRSLRSTHSPHRGRVSSRTHDGGGWFGGGDGGGGWFGGGDGGCGGGDGGGGGGC